MNLTIVLAVIHIKTYSFHESIVKIATVKWGGKSGKEYFPPPAFTVRIQTRIILVYKSNSSSRKINPSAGQGEGHKIYPRRNQSGRRWVGTFHHASSQQVWETDHSPRPCLSACPETAVAPAMPSSLSAPRLCSCCFSLLDFQPSSTQNRSRREFSCFKKTLLKSFLTASTSIFP